MKSLLSAYREAKKNNFKDCAELAITDIELGGIYCSRDRLQGSTILKCVEIDSSEIMYFKTIIKGHIDLLKDCRGLIPFCGGTKFYTLK